MATPTALVTGVLGQDGSYLAELLTAKGYRVVGLDVAEPGAGLPGVEHVVASMVDAPAIMELVASTRPDEIYHLAGQSSVGRSFAEPVDTFRSVAQGTLNLLEAARTAARLPRILLAGSGEVFGDTGGEPATETRAFRPLSPYGAAKAAASHLAATYRAAYGLFACVAYFYNHESPRRPERFVTRKIVRGACRIARGLDSTLELGDTSVVRDWGWAPEYVEAAWQMLARETPEDFVIATGTSISLDDFVTKTFTRLGLDRTAHVVKSAALLRAAEIPIMRADPARAAARLGWRATVHVDELIERLVDAEQRALDAPSG
ncbi:MAG TPA: GDP-mannose 4,6-dehydratase [Polyangiaceae bacterium]|nr:GDP-mannose 4,6-dehydratase [Polyangiaceae bacterium]